MKFLGIDYGEKRVGIALSDDEGVLAFPKTILKNNRELTQNIKKLCDNEAVFEVVVGESLNSKGEPNKVDAAAKSFAKDFAAAAGLQIHWEPEFMTSMHAAIGEKKGEFRKEAVDASAAALILQRFLDKRKEVLKCP